VTVAVEPPPFAESETVTVKRAIAAQPVKSRVMVMDATAPEARSPALAGRGDVTTGAQAGPPVCKMPTLATCAPMAVAGPLLPTCTVQTRAFAGPALAVMPPNSALVPKGAKEAVTLCGAFMTTVVLALTALVTFPVQELNA